MAAGLVLPFHLPQYLQNMSAVGNGVVGDELQLRRVAQLQGTAQFPAQEPGGGFETLEDLGFPFLSNVLI